MLSREAAELVFPLSCVACGRHDRELLCADCLAAIKPARPQCLGCGALTVTGSTCYDCRAVVPLAGVLAVGPYRDPRLRAAIHALKFQGMRGLASVLGNLLARRMVAAGLDDAAAPGLSDPRERVTGLAGPGLASTAAGKGGSVGGEKPQVFPPQLVPIPLHPRRERGRGFNQARLLADAVAAHTGLPVADLLTRTRATSAQTSIIESAPARARNVAGAFGVVLPHPMLARSPSSDVGGVVQTPVSSIQRAILIDDVLTTGATLLEGAATLRAAGIPEVWAAVIARGSAR